jgi:hypothetical protein
VRPAGRSAPLADVLAVELPSHWWLPADIAGLGAPVRADPLTGRPAHGGGPFLPRLLRLRMLQLRAWQRAVLGEVLAVIGLLLGAADLASYWLIPLLPLTSTAVVLFHDRLALVGWRPDPAPGLAGAARGDVCPLLAAAELRLRTLAARHRGSLPALVRAPDGTLSAIPGSSNGPPAADDRAAFAQVLQEVTDLLPAAPGSAVICERLYAEGSAVGLAWRAPSGAAVTYRLGWRLGHGRFRWIAA